MPDADRYRAIVIGAGQAGGPLAKELARAGWKTALVERQHLGGTCVNEGCTPTKTMVASARVAYLARRARDYGVRTGRIGVDMSRVRQRKRDIVKRFGGVSPEQAEPEPNLDVLYGEARFTGPRSLEVRMARAGTRQLEADVVFINTGARPSRPPLPGLDEAGALDSTSVMELDSVPRHLLVLGGGYVGLEFGQMFRRFGSSVTIVHRGSKLLSREDPDVSEAIAEILREDGVEVVLGAEALRVSRHSSGRVRLSIQSGGKKRTISASHLLVATGRTSNSDSLNLEAAGIEADTQGFIRVNERLETSAPGVFALGDVKGPPAFTHISYDDYRIVRTNLLGGGGATTKDRLVPYTVFIDPQLGRVGLTEQEARERKHDVRVARMGMDSVARAIELDETRGFIKAVVDADGQILGCAVLGIEGGEIMALFQMAMMGRVGWPVLHDAVFAHPTLAESLNNLFDELAEAP